MPLFQSNNVDPAKILWVDSNTLLDQNDQDGSIQKPYSTIQQAIDFGTASSINDWHIMVNFGSYASDPITIPPNKDFIIEGQVRRGSMQTGSITWTVTGNLTSTVAFRRIIAGTITINDDTIPAIASTLSFIDSECKGINVTGTSNVTTTMGGATLASFTGVASGRVAMIVTGNIEVKNGLLLADSVQFQSGCTFINAGYVFAAGSSFNQAINLTQTSAQFNDSVWGSAYNITFTGSQGLVQIDARSIANFIDGGGVLFNGQTEITDQRSTGWLNGGSVTRNSGRILNISAGQGYIFDHDDITQLVTWSSGSITLPANLLSDVYINSTGTISSAAHPASHRNNIILATAQTDSTNIIALSQENVETTQIVPQMSEYATKLFGALHISGLITEVYSGPSLQLQVDSGSYYNGIHFTQVTANAPITFRYWYRDGSGGWTTVASQTAINSNFYDNGTGTLTALTTGQWKKDLLFVSKNDSATEYHVVYAQEYYSSQDEAIAGHIPAVSDGILTTSLRLAGLVTQGASSLVSVVIDLKPKLGQFSTGTTAVTDHGLLSGLSDDDHPQYQLRTEKNTASGYVGLNASSKIFNGAYQVYGSTSNTAAEGNDSRIPTQAENDALVGTDGSPSSSNKFVTDSDPRNTNARTPTAHASTHLPNGSDPLTTAAASDIGTANTVGTANSFSRSDHGHNLPFATVQTVLSGATSSISVNNQLITNVATPVSGTDAVNKNYVDAISTGLLWKQPVKAATTVAGTLATSFENGDVIDGITLATGNRILIKDQASQAENGIYTVNASGAPTRATDMDAWAEVPNAAVFVEQGTVNADRGYVCTSDSGGTLGTTAITFIQFSSINSYTAGNGITLTGQTISVNHDGDGLTFNGVQLSLELDGSTLSKSASGVKVADGGITNTQVGAIAGIALTKLAATTASRALVSDGSGFITVSTTTAAEIAFVSGVTSAIQTQLNTKIDTNGNGLSKTGTTLNLIAPVTIANGGTNSITALNNNRIMISSGSAIVEASAITANRALASNASGIPVAATTTDTELNFVSGVTSAIQTQLNNKQPLDATLTSLAAYNTNGLLTQTAADTFTGRSLTQPAAGLTITNSDGVAGNPTFALANDLGAIEALNTNAILVRTGTDTWAARTLTAPAEGLTITNPAGTAGNPTFAFANDLAAIEVLNSNGILTRTATDTWAARTITGPASGITVSNGNGVAGNPTLALANDLSAVEGLATNGLAVRTATDTWTTRSLTAPAAGLTITNNDGISGNPTFAFANDLGAIEALNSNGILTRTGTDTWLARTITGTTNTITITNGDGIAGNPTITIADNPVFPGTASQTQVSGTTAQRPGSPTSGMVRFNSTLGIPEMYMSGAGGWMPTFMSGGRNFGTLWDDFLKDAVAANQWESVISGTGAAIGSVNTGVDSTSFALGVEQLSTGTTTTGIAAILCSTVSELFGYAYHFLEWRVQIPTLSTAGQEFDFFAGFSDNAGAAGAGTDGAYFWYDRNTSVNWRFSSINNGAATSTSSTTAVAAGQWYKLGIEVNAAGTLITYYIDDVSVGTIATNIPTGTGRTFGPAIKIEKSAGGTSRTALVDYVRYFYALTTSR